MDVVEEATRKSGFEDCRAEILRLFGTLNDGVTQVDVTHRDSRMSDDVYISFYKIQQCDMIDLRHLEHIFKFFNVLPQIFVELLQ